MAAPGHRGRSRFHGAARVAGGDAAADLASGVRECAHQPRVVPRLAHLQHLRRPALEHILQRAGAPSEMVAMQRVQP